MNDNLFLCNCVYESVKDCSQMILTDWQPEMTMQRPKLDSEFCCQKLISSCFFICSLFLPTTTVVPEKLTVILTALYSTADCCISIFYLIVWMISPSNTSRHTHRQEHVPETEANIISVRFCFVNLSIPSGSWGSNCDRSIFGCGLFHSGNSSSSNGSSAS